MRQAQDEFADFYRASKDPCLRAVTAVTGDRELAEELLAEAFTRELSIGLFPGCTRMLLITDGAPLRCGSTPGQPAAHITPTGTPIRSRH